MTLPHKKVWTIYVCEGCGGQVFETYEYKHQGEGHGKHVRVEVVPLELAQQLARDVQTIAEAGGMPDSYKQTDSRMIRAQEVLDEDEE